MAVMPLNLVEAAKATKPQIAVVNGHAPRPADHDEVAELLSHVDPDCGYDDWIAAMMAVHSATGGSATGLSIVDNWSANGRKYKGTRDVQSRWQSFKAGGVGKRPARNMLGVGTRWRHGGRPVHRELRLVIDPLQIVRRISRRIGIGDVFRQHGLAG